MVAVLKSQMSDRKIPIRSILDSYRYFFAEILTDFRWLSLFPTAPTAPAGNLENGALSNMP